MRNTDSAAATSHIALMLSPRCSATTARQAAPNRDRAAQASLPASDFMRSSVRPDLCGRDSDVRGGASSAGYGKSVLTITGGATVTEFMIRVAEPSWRPSRFSRGLITLASRTLINDSRPLSVVLSVSTRVETRLDSTPSRPLPLTTFGYTDSARDTLVLEPTVCGLSPLLAAG